MDSEGQLPSRTAPNYRLDLKYIGTDFHGWQSQPSGRGIQDCVEKALSTFLRHPVRVIASSRTDSGVHAEQQVTIFRSETEFDATRWMKALNGILPPSVGAVSLTPAAPDFHPVYHAKAKVYCYRVWSAFTRHPFIWPYVWNMHRQVDVKAMREGAKYFVGTHDYTSFCALDSSAKTRVRTVLAVELVEKGPLLEIWVVGTGFLKQMVRNMAGTLVEVGLGKMPPEGIKTALLAKDRNAAGPTARAEGLTLSQVIYNEPVVVADALKVDPTLELGTGFYWQT